MAQQEHNYPNKQSPNDYQTIFNEDAEDTKEDYQSFLAGLDNNSPQAGGDTPQNKNNHTKHKNNNNNNNSGGNNDNDNNKNQYNNNNNNNNGNDWNKASGNYKWQWDAGNQWKDYKPKDTKAIESQYGSTDTTYIEAYGVLYQIDFVNLKQTNTENGRFRKIRRVAINHTDNSKQSNHGSKSKNGSGSGSGRGSHKSNNYHKGGNKGGGHSNRNNNNKTDNYSGGGYNNGNMYNNDNNGSGKGRDNNSNNKNNGKGYSGKGYKNGNNNKNDNYPSCNNNNGNNSNNNNNGSTNGGKSYNNGNMYQRNDNYPSPNKNNKINNSCCSNNSYGNGSSAVWQVMLGQSFTNYDSCTSKFIESKFKQNKVKMFECNIRNNKYYINLNDMTQMNPKTGRSRKIKRVGGMSVNNNNNQNGNNNNNKNNYNDNGNNNSGNGRDNRGQMYYPHPPNMRQDDEKKNSAGDGRGGGGRASGAGGSGCRGSGGSNNSNQNSNDFMHQGSPNNNNNNNQNTHPSQSSNSYNQPMPNYHPNSNANDNNNNYNNHQNRNDNNRNRNNNNNNIAKPPSHKWQWKDDSGIFIDYDSTSSSQMEVLYQNRAKVYKYKRRSQVYTINFNQLKQYNDKTNASRDIRRVPMSTKSNNGNNHNSGPTMKWQFYDGCFIDYDRKISITMEKAYNNQQNTFSFNNEKTKSKYVINFTSMKQKNMKSKNERDIRRVPLSVKGGTAPPPKTRQRTNQGWPDPNTWKGPKATAKRKVFGKRIMTLYHITDAKAGDLIFKDHKMIRGGKGMFGGGIYFAETIPAAKHKAEHHGVLITAKVFVGKEHVVKDSTAGHFTFQDMQKMGCDSVYAPYGSGKGAAERVVYNFDQVCVIKKTDKY